MAGTAKAFSKVLHKQLTIHAAWFPIVNTIKLGDYGLMSDGVLVPMGNISEFGATFTTSQSPSAKLDFKSTGTRVIKFAAGAQVTSLPNQPIDAKIVIEFAKKSSFLLKAQLSVTDIDSLAQVAGKVAQHPKWDPRFRVVSSTYTGQDCVILSTVEADTKIEISGKADSLQKFDLGKLDAGFSFQKSKDVGLELLGQSGVVGLKMFTVKSTGMAQIVGMAHAKATAELAIDEDPGMDDDV